MKKLLLFGIVLSFAILAGCGGSDSPTDSNGGGGPAGPQRITANTTAGAPSMADANDAIWNAVAATAIDVSTANSPKLPAPHSLNAPDSIYFKAIVDNDTLYLRIEYTDNDLNQLKSYLSLVDVPNKNFTRNTLAYEDQIFVMFEGLPNNAWDVWNWRSMETGPARLAEGMRYEGGNLITDAGGQVVAIFNPLDGVTTGRPQWVHNTGPAYTGDILYMQDTSSITPFLTDPGWSQSQIVPGYVIDTAVYGRVQPGQPYASSRWDIWAIHDFNGTTDRLSVVMKCAMNTGRTDDLVMADSVNMKIGVFDDQTDFNVSGSRRGFSGEFWLIF